MLHQSDGCVLLTERPAGKPWAGYWEFPGGKIEAGESALQALSRELHEELGIDIDRACPWITFEYVYPEKRVRLHFCRVLAWRGTPHGREAQRISWEDPRAIGVQPLLPANESVVRALNLPPAYAITNAAKLGVEPFMQCLQVALEGGVRLIQVRERDMAPEALVEFAQRVVLAARPYGARVLVNGETASRPSLACGPADVQDARMPRRPGMAESGLDPIGDAVVMAREAGADGVHMQAGQLMRLKAPPDIGLWAASCHNAAELARAAELHASFVVLSPVLPTPTHPEALGMGWDQFAALVREYPLPVYALGGMKLDLLGTARQHGAHGIALLSGIW